MAGLKKLIVSLLLTIVIGVFAQSLSKRDRYFTNLQKWYFYAQKNDWENADKIEKKINLNHILLTKTQLYPDSIRQKINSLLVNQSKSVDDLIEISILYSRLGDIAKSKQYLDKAKSLDPIRNDFPIL